GGILGCHHRPRQDPCRYRVRFHEHGGKSRRRHLPYPHPADRPTFWLGERAVRRGSLGVRRRLLLAGRAPRTGHRPRRRGAGALAQEKSSSWCGQERVRGKIVATEQGSFRWGVLINTFLFFATAFGMGWTYIVMLVPPILQELGLNIADWGTLWSA